jgi:hypothetical protein
MRSVEEIEAEIGAVNLKLSLAKEEARWCRERNEALYAERREAWKAEDEKLPQVMVLRGQTWRGPSKHPYVVTKRTEKTIFARPFGERFEPEQFRLGKDGRYRAYGKYNTGHLEFPDEPT